MLGPITVQIRQEGVGTDLWSTYVFYQLMPVISLFLFIIEEYITGLPKQQWVRGIQIRKGKKSVWADNSKKAKMSWNRVRMNTKKAFSLRVERTVYTGADLYAYACNLRLQVVKIFVLSSTGA